MRIRKLCLLGFTHALAEFLTALKGRCHNPHLTDKGTESLHKVTDESMKPCRCWDAVSCLEMSSLHPVSTRPTWDSTPALFPGHLIPVLLDILCLHWLCSPIMSIPSAQLKGSFSRKPSCLSLIPLFSSCRLAGTLSFCISLLPSPWIVIVSACASLPLDSGSLQQEPHLTWHPALP